MATYKMQSSSACNWLSSCWQQVQEIFWLRYMATKPQAQKSVLVVRPLREQDAFLQLLDGAGISYSYNPIMRIVPVTEPADQVERIRELILQFAQFDRAIFISANAAEQALHWLDQYWPMLPGCAAILPWVSRRVKYFETMVAAYSALSISKIQKGCCRRCRSCKILTINR